MVNIPGGGAPGIHVALPIRWAYIDQGQIVEVTYRDFEIDGVFYNANFLYNSEDPIVQKQLFEIGLYKIIHPPLEVGEFERATLTPSTEWTIDHDKKEITQVFVIEGYNLEDTFNMINSVIELRLDDMARKKQYKNMIDAISYMGSNNEQFKREAQYCSDLRDSVWLAISEFCDQVQKGLISKPKYFSEVDALIPDISWDKFIE